MTEKKDAPAFEAGDKVPENTKGRPAAPVGGMVNGLRVQADGTLGEDAHTGPGGLRLPNREIAGGEIAETITEEAPAPASTDPLALQRRAMKARAFEKVAAMAGRPLSEWGLVGKGDTVHGHMILLDLDSGEKVRVVGDVKIEDDRVFANARNFAEAVVSDEGLKAL